ncbi:MAG: ABC transporter substrate-binding protein [Chitinophagales bacterium]|nr:amino acid ABC transporter substrate-binding protein [Bacteroidota bacterium]
MISVQNLPLRLSGNKWLVLCLFFLFVGFPACTPHKKTHKSSTVNTNKPTPKPPPTIKPEKPTTVNTTPPVKDIKPLPKESTQPKPTKSTFNISFLLPFYANYNNLSYGNDSIYGKSLLAISFYQGAEMALEELQRKGMRFNINLYDTENNSSRISQLLSEANVAQSDMLIGPLYSKNIPSVASYCQSRNIYLVSPLSSKINGIYDNPYFINASPSTSSHYEKIVHFLQKNYGCQKFLLIAGNNTKDMQTADEIINITFTNPAGERQTPIRADRITYVSQSQSEIASYLDPANTNYIVVASYDEVVINDLLRKLAILSSDYDIVLVGMPTWDQIESINLDYLEMLKFHMTSSYFVNSDNMLQKQFAENYKNKFGDYPDEYACKAYDIVRYCVGELKNGMQLYNTMPSSGTFSKFDIQPSKRTLNQSKADYFENKAVYMLKYTDFDFVPID